MEGTDNLGGVADLKHFLPRLLELVAEDDCVPFEREVLFGELQLAQWQQWPVNERDTVMQYFKTVWDDCLRSTCGWLWVDELCCGLGRAVETMSPFLTVWTQCKAMTGYSHLSHFIDGNVDCLIKKKKLSNAFWSDAHTQMSEVVSWLRSPDTYGALEGIFESAPDADFAEALAEVLDRLRVLRTAMRAN